MRIYFLSATVLSLALLSCAEPTKVRPSKALGVDEREIVASILSWQAESSRDNITFFNDNPEMPGLLHDFIDYRFCVADELAGSTAEFRIRSGEDAFDAPQLSPANQLKNWEQADKRTRMPRNVLPKDLRWDSSFKYCPLGVLMLSHPDVMGDRAMIFVQNDCSGWCGWGGVYQLHRTETGWEIGEKVEGWVS